MKKILLSILFALIILTGCQLPTSTNEIKNVMPESSNSGQIKKQKDSGHIVEQEYDVEKLGKEIQNNNNRSLYFSNENVICYLEDKTESDTMVYLYDRKTEKKHCIIKIKDIDTIWGDMQEKEHCLYMAVGVKKKEKEKSYILKIDEKKLKGELIEIERGNTILSSVVCTDNMIYVWYMNEQGNIKEYCLCSLDNKEIHPIQSWIYERGENGSGQEMVTFGANANELLCFVKDSTGDAVIDVYDDKGEKSKSIPIDFEDCQYVSGEEDPFWNLYCCDNLLFFQTIDHRIFVAKYDGENIELVDEKDFSKWFAKSQGKDKFSISDGTFAVLRTFLDKIVICGNLDHTDKLYIWETDAEKINCFTFKVDNAEIVNYRMLSENEVILTVDYGEEENKKIYCNLN